MVWEFKLCPRAEQENVVTLGFKSTMYWTKKEPTKLRAGFMQRGRQVQEILIGLEFKSEQTGPNRRQLLIMRIMKLLEILITQVYYYYYYY
jgi:hypothetical protein